MTYHISSSNLKQYFLNILSKKDYSVAELIRKGEVKGISGSEVKEAIHWLEEYGYVNDMRYASNLVEHYKPTKGSRWISMKLQQKLIPAHIIDEVLIKLEDTATDQIKKKVEQKYSVTDWNNVDPKVMGKIQNFLARQGFTRPFDMINEWKEESNN
jgi:regulatory protein